MGRVICPLTATLRALGRAAVLGLVALAGCAAPSKDEAQVDSGMRAFHLCRGIQVSNAPAADEARRIRQHSPTITVRNVTLLTAPTRGCLSAGYGRRRNRAPHEGLDISTFKPAPIRAAAAGRIADVRRYRGYGLTVDIDHGRDVMTRYAHLSRLADGVREGARVKAGETIGLTGASGNATGIHLHYEIRVDGRPIDPLRKR